MACARNPELDMLASVSSEVGKKRQKHGSVDAVLSQGGEHHFSPLDSS